MFKSSLLPSDFSTWCYTVYPLTTSQLSFSPTEGTLTCHSRTNIGINNKINGNCFIFKVLVWFVPAHCHDLITLLNNRDPLFMLLTPPVLFLQ